jgi:DNA polymerase elongation subunit (family B)
VFTDEGRLCGLWIDSAGQAHAAISPAGGGRRQEEVGSFRPFAWLGEGAAGAAPAGIEVETLKGEGVFRHLAHAPSLDAFDGLLKATREAGAVDVIRPLESQFLLQHKLRLYRELGFKDLRRCQLELAWDDAGPITLIAMRLGPADHELRPSDPTPAAEKAVLETFTRLLTDWDPDVVEGHGIFSGPLDQLRDRCRKHKIPITWGRFGQKATFRNSRLKLAERFVDFTRCDAPGRTFLDTQLLVQTYDVSARDMSGYSRLAAAEYFGITAPETLAQIAALTDLLLPTYFEQARIFPMLLQDATLRGQTSKIDLLFQEEYYHARQACPAPPEIAPFDGGYTKSFQTGVFRQVLHFDVASLYPSLLLAMGRNPQTDTLGVFGPLLRSLREYRYLYKQRARSAPTPDERAEAQARQTAFKILINSFYGYLGFSGARFGDGELAAEVTRQGRELLQVLIGEFGRLGCLVLEADTDGIYLSSERYFTQPEILLELARGVLPPGIELEFDGSYQAMLCYKAKNYALYDGRDVTLRGSAFRSRAMEPFLQRLTDQLVQHLLGRSAEPPAALWESYRQRIVQRRLPVEELAKNETLSQSPESYEQLMASGGKPRRAALEAALQLKVRPRMGERVSYYIGPKTKGRTSDWQRARAAALYDAEQWPYDPGYYLDKLDDWKTRYAGLLPAAEPSAPTETQGELL